MKKKRHLLSKLWESYPEFVTAQPSTTHQIDVAKFIADMLSVGPFYYYVINIADYSLSQVSTDAPLIHGLPSPPAHLQDIMDFIHPEDMDFVVRAEKASIEKMKEIGVEHQLLLKTSYCFRMRVADGSYHLFHHQAIHLAKDEQDRLTFALNIHTDIEHITKINNQIVLVNGVGARRDYCLLDLSLSKEDRYIPTLSLREMEVLRLIAKGHASSRIADLLFISEHTVKVHRKNLLRKTKTVNSNDMIRTCMECGLL
ncbi:LuxR C-terminal-related transcriptional regulator [Sphingobacterium suaedae]|uniref:LuxR C-terminal-related transcriptional regulator n=1 Tax=Sphingobacterium suaedae TaxID=1686402 RepID=A0ABW5KNM4_9SPHI